MRSLVQLSAILLDFGPNSVNLMQLPIGATLGPSRTQAAAALVAPCAAAATLVADAGKAGMPQAAQTAALSSDGLPSRAISDLWKRSTFAQILSIAPTSR
jgi:hypothetical protein